MPLLLKIGLSSFSQGSKLLVCVCACVCGCICVCVYGCACIPACMPLTLDRLSPWVALQWPQRCPLHLPTWFNGCELFSEIVLFIFRCEWWIASPTQRCALWNTFSKCKLSVQVTGMDKDIQVLSRVDSQYEELLPLLSSSSSQSLELHSGG